MYFNFVLSGYSYVEIFMPLFDECKRRKIKINIFEFNTGKLYNTLEKYADEYRKLKGKYKPNCYPVQEIKNHPGITFVIDGDFYGLRAQLKNSALQFMNDSHIKVSLNENANYIWVYERFIPLIDYAVFFSPEYTQAYGFNRPDTISKNLYLGSPRYDFLHQYLNPQKKEELYKKYKMSPKEKYVIMYPPKGKYFNNKVITMKDIEKIQNYFRGHGYKIIVKEREKEQWMKGNLRGNIHIVSGFKYPNPSIELLYLADICVFFSSSVVEECIITKTPFVDFVTDPKVKRYPFLWHNKISLVLPKEKWHSKYSKINNLLEKKNNPIFDKIINDKITPLEKLYQSSESIINKIVEIAEKNNISET